MKRLLMLSCCVVLLLPLAPPVRADVAEEVLKAQADRVETIRKARAATICIFGRGGRGGGSGVVISPDGFALSNFHVTRGAGNAMKVGMADGILYDAVIVGIDPVGDVALIKLIGREDFPYAVMADSDKVRQLDPCFAAGNPFLLANDFQVTVTFGIVSGVRRYQYPSGTLLEYADCIQTDAAINPGNSGGPLFNMQGEIIGINGRGSFEKRGRVNVGVGYAISINQIKNFLGYLKSGRIVDHATLGAQVYTDDEGRVRVLNILESSDAYRRGLRYGDEVTHFGGRVIRTTNGFKNVLGIFPRGWRVPLTYLRNGNPSSVIVRLSGVHRKGELAERIKGKSKKPPKIPQPKPGGKPKPKGKPVPKIGPQKLPAKVAKLYVARAGYMNYYFNRLQQQRVWKALLANGDYSQLKNTWAISAEGAGDLPATFELSDSQIVAGLPGGKLTLEVDPNDPMLDKDLRPLGSGGLLVALHLWRRLLVEGVDGFGSLFYLGTMPVAGHQGLADCLVGIHGRVECRFLFDSGSGRLLAMEMFSSDDSDPCELFFHEYEEVDGRQIPRRIQVRHGDFYEVNYQVKKISFGKSVEK